MDNMTIDPKGVSDPVALRREMRRALATISGKWKLEILSGCSISASIGSGNSSAPFLASRSTC